MLQNPLQDEVAPNLTTIPLLQEACTREGLQGSLAGEKAEVSSIHSPVSQRLSRQFAGAFSVSGVRIVLSGVTGIVLARMLGPVARGEYALMLLWSGTFGVFALFGNNEALAYYTAARPHAARQYLAGALRLTARFVAVSLPFALLAIYWLLHNLRGEARIDGVVLALFCIPLAVIYTMALGLLQGASQFRDMNRLMLANDFAYCLLTLVAVLLARRFGPSVLFAIAAFAGSALFTAINSVRLLRAGFLNAPVCETGPEVREQLSRYGRSVAPANLIALLGARVDEMVVAQLLPAGALGLYSVGKMTMVGINAVPASLSLVFLPRVIIAHQTGNLVPLFRRVLIRSFAACAGIFALSYFAIPFVVPIVFGSAYRESVRVAQLLLLSALLAGVVELGITTLKGMKLLRSALMCRVTVVVLLVGFLFVAIPLHGLVGAAGACAAANASGALVILITVCNNTGDRKA
jgi:O-antigen/teichoic acid export membrane protein